VVELLCAGVGGLLFIFGIILIAKPDETWLFLIYAIGLWFIAYAVYSLVSSVKYRSFSSKLFIVTFVLAILLLIAGIVLILSPTVGMTFIGVVIGIALIVNGLEFILLAIAEKLIDRRQKQSTSGRELGGVAHFTLLTSFSASLGRV